MAVITIEWLEEDIKEAITNAGKECSPENIQAITSIDILRLIEERSIETGWDILNSVAEQLL